MEKRIEKIWDFLGENDAALIMSDTNRLYFTGFNSSAGAVLITKTQAFLLVDFRYFEMAKKRVSHLEVRLTNRLYRDIGEILQKLSVKNIFIETDTVTLDSFSSLQKALESFNISNENSLTQKITQMRSIKDGGEIALIEKAQALTDQAFSYILDFIKVGATEKEIALKMEFFMREGGSEGVAFDFITVSGKNSSLPHGVPTDKKIEKGDFVTMDFGAVVGGYRSDMTRTVAVGFVTDKQREIYETVLKAQKAALNAIKAGVPCKDIDKAARDIITNAGFGDCFGHGLGHSVGLEIHESPACNTRDITPLQTGMIMTVEPGIYIENEFGVRIEDMVVITNNGYRNLTKSPNDLIIL